MLDSLAIGDKLIEVRMMLTPDESFRPKTTELTITSVSSSQVRVSGSKINRKTYKKSEIGVFMNGLFKDSYTMIERRGVCLPDFLESFKVEMLDSMHADLVKYRLAMLSMQKELNRYYSNEPNLSITVDWDRYECFAVSGSYQDITPVTENDLEWSSTKDVEDTIFISIDDKDKGTRFEIAGLEGFNDTQIINQLKKAIAAYEIKETFV